ncbi:MAG: tetratricopeptide repeat protein [Pirellulales bacterium]|nr:tetratricopeptide repeat protein [Pirellulales bacterium]
MKEHNMIINTLPQVFESDYEPEFSTLLVPLKTDSRWVDSMAHLSQFYGRDIPNTREEFETMLQVEENPDKRATLLAGIARCYNSQMKLIRGAELLGYAWSLLEGRQNEHTAFVLLEMSRFLIIVGNMDTALLMLTQIPHLTQSEYLLRLADYYQLANLAVRGQPEALARLEESAEWFLERGQKASVIAHYRMLARLYLARGDQANAERIYKAGKELAAWPELQFCLALLHNDTGEMHFHRGNRDEAFQDLHTALELAEYPYSKIDTLDLIGRCLMHEKRYDEAERFLAEGLQIALEHGTVIIVPALALYLGECHEQLGNLGTARFFYQEASRSSVNLMDSGFPATPARLRATTAVVRFLEENSLALKAGKPTITENTPIEEDDCALLSEHSLKEIRAIFQNTLYDLTRRRFPSQQETVRHLNIASRTVSNLRRRFRELGSPDAPPRIVNFIKEHLDLDWKTINLKFDDQLLLNLHEQLDGNRKAMGEQLGVSYPHLSRLVTDALQRRVEASSERRHNEKQN